MDSTIETTSEIASEAVQSEEISECAFCFTPLHSSYFLLDALPACEACRYRREEESRIGPGSSDLLRAAAAGFGASLGGCILYYAVAALTEREYAIIAILVGAMVGGAVRWGSRHKGGRACQAMAIFFTYMAIATSYLPAALEQLPDPKKTPAPAAQPAANSPNPAPAKAAEASTADEPLTAGTVVLGIVALFALAAILPVVAGFESILGLLIIGIGLWQAWSMNRRKTLEITGPFRVGSPPASATPA